MLLHMYLQVAHGLSVEYLVSYIMGSMLQSLPLYMRQPFGWLAASCCAFDVAEDAITC